MFSLESIEFTPYFIIYVEIEDVFLQKFRFRNRLFVYRRLLMVGTKSRGYSNSGRFSEGEYSMPFFCTRHSPTENTIKSIQLQDGQRITDQKKILEEIKNFYSSLFSEKKTQDQNLDTLFKEKHVRKLSLSESKILEGELMLDEILA